MIKEKTRTQDNTGVKYALEILRKSNEPMSIDQIRAKFDPPFPFQVKCVRDVVPDRKDSPYTPGSIQVGTIISVIGLPDEHNHYPVDYKLNNHDVYLHPSLEKWVLI